MLPLPLCTAWYKSMANLPFFISILVKTKTKILTDFTRMVFAHSLFFTVDHTKKLLISLVNNCMSSLTQWLLWYMLCEWMLSIERKQRALNMCLRICVIRDKYNHILHSPGQKKVLNQSCLANLCREIL